MPKQDDLNRLRLEYAKREHRLSGSDIYSLFNMANMCTIQQRQRDVLALLRRQGFYPLDAKRLLEIGCGRGGVLLEYLSYGANPGYLYGIDLLPNLVLQAHAILPQLALACSDGQYLPFPAQSFDLIFQYTAFSSIIDDVIKANLAGEMLRVLKQGGMILWYDFWLNPTNPQTRGIRPQEIRQLFPNCTFKFRKITLAPPIARRLVPISWMLALLLESLKIFNTHYLVAIQPR